MKNPTTLPGSRVFAAHRRMVVLIALPIFILIIAASLWATGGNFLKGLYSSAATCCSWQAETSVGLVATVGVPGGEPVTVRAVGLMAGTSIEVRGADTVSVPSRFTARYGEVDTSSGIYTAPEFMPPSGLDYITVRVDGKEQRFTVRVLPNPNIPGSDEPRLIRVPQGFFLKIRCRPHLTSEPYCPQSRRCLWSYSKKVKSMKRLYESLPAHL